MDKQAKTNVYFFSGFVLAFLAYLSVYTYKDVRYSNFNLLIGGKPTLSYDPLFAKSASVIAPSSSNSQFTTYQHLPISWWLDKAPAYSVDSSTTGLWFKVTPTIKGDIALISPAEGTRLADIGFEIVNSQGQMVRVMVPGQWYKVRQYGQWYSVEFEWK